VYQWGYTLIHPYSPYLLHLTGEKGYGGGGEREEGEEDGIGTRPHHRMSVAVVVVVVVVASTGHEVFVEP